MSFYVFAWIASIFYAFEAILGKLISKHSVKNPWLFNFLWGMFGLILIATFALAHHVQMPQQWGLLLAASIFYTLGGLLFVIGIYYFDISALAPLFNFRTVFAVILSALILQEVLTIQQYLLILVIFLAGIFVTMDESFSLKSFFSWKMLIILADMVGLAFMGIFIKKAIAVDGYWTVTLWLSLLAQIFLLATVPMFWRDIKALAGRQIPGVLATALIGFIATLAANKAFSSNVSITSTIVSLPLSMVLAFLFSVFAPHLLEKHSHKIYIIRFVSAGVMFVAAIKLSL